MLYNVSLMLYTVHIKCCLFVLYFGFTVNYNSFNSIQFIVTVYVFYNAINLTAVNSKSIYFLIVIPEL